MNAGKNSQYSLKERREMHFAEQLNQFDDSRSISQKIPQQDPINFTVPNLNESDEKSSVSSDSNGKETKNVTISSPHHNYSMLRVRKNENLQESSDRKSPPKGITTMIDTTGGNGSLRANSGNH